jgi:serine/threonine-protein kinase
MLRDYELLEPIAQGGRGTIYRAWQTSLKRTVAVKVLMGPEFANLAARKRFRREAGATASLNHSNIVAIYEVGEQEGWPFLSMQLIEGRDLTDVTRDKPISARQGAEWVKAIAQAVHYAHEKGIIHGDLKPSNVLVDKNDVPHVTGFGLGSHLSRRELPPRDAAYIPSERVALKSAPATPGGDVYSLGAILYQLLTARPPFLAESVARTLQLVTEAEPVSPRLLNPWVPRDLETICLKCLEKNPARRYSTAQELADELERFLRDEPIERKPGGQWRKLVRRGVRRSG